jgi:hypothetical protein
MLPNVILAVFAIVFIAVLGNVVYREISNTANQEKNI